MPDGKRKLRGDFSGRRLEQVQIGMAGTGTTDLDQYLAGARFGNRHLAQLPGPLPFDELKCFQDSASWGRISSKSMSTWRGPRNTWLMR
jgi:hypothetical protein